MFSCSMSLHIWENVTYIEVSHVRSWIFGRTGKVIIIYFTLMQMLYFLGLLIVGLLTCVHSRGMFHDCFIFVLLHKSWYLMNWESWEPVL